MRIEHAIEYADQLLYDQTGRHLSDLQSCILQQSWQGKTYGQVAALAGYSEGHIKDVAAQLWKLLSHALGERITKGNLRSRLINRIKRTLKKASSASFLSHPPAAFDQKLVGREQSLSALQSFQAHHPIVVIHGEGGVGKTVLARRFCQQFEQTLELLLPAEFDCIAPIEVTPVESLVEEWLRQHFNQPPSPNFGIVLSRLKVQLEKCNSVVLIENLETALDRNGQFIPTHRRYVDLLSVLSTAKTTTVMTSRDRLCEPSLKVHHYRLPSLSLFAWEQFFESCLKQVDMQTNRQRNSFTNTLRDMHRAYGGNAKAMEILCAAVIEEFAGNLSAYWQSSKTNLLSRADLRNLISHQVDRLRDLDPEAYRVLCRLGGDRIRNQLANCSQLSVDSILTLMWDIPVERQQQVLNSLCDRSILTLQKGFYRLHSTAIAEAALRRHS